MVRACCTECLNDHAGRLLGCQELTTGQYDQITRLYAESGNDCILDWGYELCDTTDDLAILVHSEPACFISGLYFYVCDILIDKLTGLLEVGDHDSLDADICLLTRLVLCCKRREAAVSENRSCILDGQVDTQVWLIGTILLHGLEERNTCKWRARCTVICTILGKDRRQYIFDYGEYILLCRKCHLHIQLIEFTRRSVTTSILITEARCNLEITVKTGSHQELLELLRCLRKCIELARMLSGRNEVVTRTLRRRSRQDRGRDLEEVMLHHGLTKCRNYIAAQDDVFFTSGLRRSR